VTTNERSSTITCARVHLRPHRRPAPQPVRALFQRPTQHVPTPHLQEIESLPR
jgi:hypothetical protein